ncbi:hypothetical protein BOX15_Mlig012322g1 [Macrostomum lignano]|uniref:AIG1-type G domain-containing protein n=1 Tax=Macrostomum lignano TaxID=282301 RepID=A0A267EMZ5_9PLAT|nr:hypothetical protein BOX15_Mlig012322g1 [Macrostomum lignano]
MSAEQPQDSSQITTVVLMSKTGSGKSSLANTLLNEKSFEVGNGMRSQTKKCEAQMRTVRGRSLLVVDTPGTMDSKDVNMPQGELLRTLNKCPCGVDAFLVVARADVRFTNEECQAIRQTVDVFGPESCKRVIVVFSRGDHFDNDINEFKEELTAAREEIPELDKMMKDFGDRYVLMDNGKKRDTEVQERQVASLMGLIDEVSKLNPSKYLKKDLEKQTEERKRREEAEAQKQRDEAKKMDKMKAKVKLLEEQQQLLNAQRQQPQPGFVDIMSSIGQGAGAILASPVVGVAKLVDSAFG